MKPTVNRRNFVKLSGTVLGGLAAGTTVVAAERTDRFIVDTRGTSRRRLERAGLEVVHDLAAVDIAVVEGAESDLQRVAKKYAPDTEAQFDLPVDPVTAEEVDLQELVPDDESATDEPGYPLQWDKQALDVPAAHEVTRGEGTRVAIIDTGVGANHPDLEHAVNAGLSRDFTGDGFGAPGPWGGDHGTHVAGIVAANDQNEAGVVGTAPGTEIVDCRVFAFGQLASFADILAALVYAASVDCDAANMSLGAYPIPRQGLGSFYGKTLNRVTTFANQQGTLLVVAAGNDAADLQHDGRVCADFDGDDEDECAAVISLPNEAAQAVSVSATGPIGFLWDADGDGAITDLVSPPESPAFYTNYGTNAIDIGAPGGDADLEAVADDPDGDVIPWFQDLVLNTLAIPDQTDLGDTSAVTYTYGWIAGTSMAAPQVTGAAALVKSANPDYNANQVESALERAADVPGDFDKSFYGSGFLNLVDAL